MIDSAPHVDERNVGATDATGATPLTTASQESSDPGIVTLLLEAGAEIDFLTAVTQGLSLLLPACGEKVGDEGAVPRV
jgi:hypothetical protein